MLNAIIIYYIYLIFHYNRTIKCPDFTLPNLLSDKKLTYKKNPIQYVNIGAATAGLYNNNLTSHKQPIQATITIANNIHKEAIEKIDSNIKKISDINSLNQTKASSIPNDLQQTKSPEQPTQICNHKKNRIDRKYIDDSYVKSEKKHDCGLLGFRKWWERAEVDLLVNGKQITGTPIFVEDDTLRVINDNYSYFIPLGKVDYIRTNDGLKSSFDSQNNKPANK